MQEVPVPEKQALLSTVDWTQHPLSKVLNPVAVLTVKDGNHHSGCTVGWLCWTSAFPPMVCVSVAPERNTYGMLQNTKVFGLSYLHNSQIKLAGQFGYFSGRDQDKFAKSCGEPQNEYFESQHSGIRLFTNAVAAYECKVVNVVKTGDHDLFVAEVVHCYVSTNDAKQSLHCVGPTPVVISK
eukprot:TRINITY_DN18602_c0_g1_i1.p2 TRINITY_DN18602_c0_g1~~TRINITY_DN18602_c0_g1_i1.p2  ORF type:complete len:182 (-),score=56.88 TRINITY_DN18602_c0_g1_i1:92-637(-)